VAGQRQGRSPTVSTTAWDWVGGWGRFAAEGCWLAGGAEQVLYCQLLQPDETEATAVEVRLGIEVLVRRSVSEQVVVGLAVL
jgi:hypothetical protein